MHKSTELWYKTLLLHAFAFTLVTHKYLLIMAQLWHLETEVQVPLDGFEAQEAEWLSEMTFSTTGNY